uniref:Uncharacterized protein n=1 Tax=Rhizophora mucronata TaxID=61149 RepID=A0A2P2N5V4_RHIMU
MIMFGYSHFNLRKMCPRAMLSSQPET